MPPHGPRPFRRASRRDGRSRRARWRTAGGIPEIDNELRIGAVDKTTERPRLDAASQF